MPLEKRYRAEPRRRPAVLLRRGSSRPSFCATRGFSTPTGSTACSTWPTRLLNDDPGKARRLAELCADLADAADAPAAVPRADYIRAGAHHLNGEFDDDLRLTEAAYDGYVALGMNLEALRTNVGKMAALLELGRYQEALDAGQIVLDTLGGKGELEVTPTPQEVRSADRARAAEPGGCCYEHMGRYEEALEAYAVAEERYRILGMNRNVSARCWTIGASSSRTSAGATKHWRRTRPPPPSSRRRASRCRTPCPSSNIGETHLQLANYTSSLDAFERARRLLESFDARAVEYFLLRNTADAYLALNLYSEALASYQEADGLLQEHGHGA